MGYQPRLSGTILTSVYDSERTAWQDLNHIGCLACLTGDCCSTQCTKQMLQLNASSFEDKQYPFLGSIVYDLLHASKDHTRELSKS